MTTKDRIHAAWKRAELIESPTKYVELILGLCGQALRTEQEIMCEELYELGLLQRFHYPVSDGSGILCYERRYMPLNHIGDEQQEKYQALQMRVLQLEELLRVKSLRYSEVG